MNIQLLLLLVFSLTSFISASADSSVPKIKVRLIRYTLNSNGAAPDSVSKVRFTIQTPDGKMKQYPRTSKEWDVKNGDTVELDEPLDLQSAFIQNDRLVLKVQIYRDDKEIAPCDISMEDLSQYSRTVYCRSDVATQRKMGRSNDKIVDESLEIKVTNESIDGKPHDRLALKRGFHLE